MNRRWYDQERSCPKLITQIQAIPQPEVRDFCAQVLLAFGDKLRKGLQEKDKKTIGVNSIGHEAIASLYNFGRQKRRWYDRESTLHSAVGLLYTLTREGLGIIGFKLGDTFGLLQIYAQVCREVGQAPDLQQMTRIATVALQVGTKEAEELLISIVGPELYSSLMPLNLPEA